MDKAELERQFDAAIDEYTCSCSVVITSDNPQVPHGSGVAVRYCGKEYILTAAHVLRAEPDDTKLRFLGRPDTPLQMLKGKRELADAIDGGMAPAKFSSSTSIPVIERLTANADDIAALKVERLQNVLAHTIFHDLSGQGEATVYPGVGITIFGFPGELARRYEHQITRKRGITAFPHITVQRVKDISCAPESIDSSIYFLTDFDYPEDQCDPHGMSGCGGWNIPLPRPGELWSPQACQLVGIEIGHYKGRNLLQFVRIERVLRLLSTGQ
jgi:hypothetical protein